MSPSSTAIADRCAGLAASDFTVLEDGQERPIVAFSAVDLSAPADTTPSWMRDVSPDVVSNIAPLEGRLIVILMDRTIRPEAQPLGRRIAEAAVNALRPWRSRRRHLQRAGCAAELYVRPQSSAYRDQPAVHHAPGPRHG